MGQGNFPRTLKPAGVDFVEHILRQRFFFDYDRDGFLDLLANEMLAKLHNGRNAATVFTTRMPVRSQGHVAPPMEPSPSFW